MNLGDKYPIVPVNAVVKNIKDLEGVPLRATRAAARSSCATWPRSRTPRDIVTGYALVNGRRTVYIPVTKRADASTLAVVELVKANLPKFQSVVPDDIKVSFEFDQSPVVIARDQRPRQGRRARRGAHRPDGAALPARLAQRVHRRAQHSALAARRGRSRCGSPGRRST